MNEIEKMYENAGITYEERYSDCLFDIEKGCPLNTSCDLCNYSKEKHIYPLFTAEKQLELVKICFDKYGKIGKVTGVDRCILYIVPDVEEDQSFIVTDYINFETWEESIAGLINNLWQDLTEEDKRQIKEILNE